MSDVTVPEAADQLGVTPAYVRRLIAQGDLAARRIGPDTRGGQWLITADDVVQLARRRAQNPPQRGRRGKETTHDHA